MLGGYLEMRVFWRLFGGWEIFDVLQKEKKEKKICDLVYYFEAPA